jgi:hypothetical protein
MARNRLNWSSFLGWATFVAIQSLFIARALPQALNDYLTMESVRHAMSQVEDASKLLLKPDAIVSNAFEKQATALGLLTKLQPPRRHRFILPDCVVSNRANALALDKLFRSKSDVNVYLESIDQLSAALEQASREASAKGDFQHQYQMAWNALGLRALVPPGASTKQPKNQVKHTPKSFVNHPKTLWPAGSYSVLTTSNFEIASQASTKQTEEIGEVCERTYAIWKQLFFDYWSDGKSPVGLEASSSTAKFSVAVFRDKAAYAKALRAEPNISISTGYYDPNRKIALFYWDGSKTLPTVVHELVHQFFFEASKQPVSLNTDNDAGYWVVEGIALYIESLSVQSVGGALIVDVGGWDAARFQAGRYRRLHDQFWIPWDEFRSSSGQAFRRNRDIAAWYSQAAGLTHLWMDSSHENRRAMSSYIASVYAGKENPSLLGNMNNDDTLREAYDRFLITSTRDEPIRPFFSERKEAVLSRCDVNTDTMLSWPDSYRSTTWLDVSFCPIDDTLFLDGNAKREPAWNIGRLNAESTLMTDRSLQAISEMTDLTELDLSNCRITDVGLEALKDHKSLKILWLNECPVTDQSIEIFLRLPQLEQLHVRGSKISLAGWTTLVTQRPRLKKSSTGP